MYAINRSTASASWCEIFTRPDIAPPLVSQWEDSLKENSRPITYNEACNAFATPEMTAAQDAYEDARAQHCLKNIFCHKTKELGQVRAIFNGSDLILNTALTDLGVVSSRTEEMSQASSIS